MIPLSTSIDILGAQWVSCIFGLILMKLIALGPELVNTALAHFNGLLTSSSRHYVIIDDLGTSSSELAGLSRVKSLLRLSTGNVAGIHIIVSGFTLDVPEILFIDV